MMLALFKSDFFYRFAGGFVLGAVVVAASQVPDLIGTVTRIV